MGVAEKQFLAVGERMAVWGYQNFTLFFFSGVRKYGVGWTDPIADDRQTIKKRTSSRCLTSETRT